MIRLIDVVGHNFMPHKFLEFSFENRGLSLIIGENKENASASSNGTGKTALLDLVSWVLFDKTIRGIGKDDVINNKVGKDCEGHQRFEVNGHPYKVSRYRGHAKFGNNVFLYEGDSDKPYSADDNKATQARIEEILGLDFDLFTTIFMFGQGVVKHFAELTDVGQKEVLERVLGIQKIDNYLKEVKARKDMLDKEAFSIAPKASSTQYIILSEEESLRSARVDEATWETELVSTIAQYDELIRITKTEDFTTQLDSIDNEIAEFKLQVKDTDDTEDEFLILKDNQIKIASDLNSNKASSKIYTDELFRLESKSKEIEDLGNIDELTTELAGVDITLVELKSDKLIQQTALTDNRAAIGEVDTQIALNKQENSRLLAEISKMSGLDGVAICPTCKGPVTKSHLEAEITKFSKEIETGTGVLTVLQGLRTEAVNTVQNLIVAISELESKISERESRKNTITTTIAKIIDNKDVSINLKNSRDKLSACNEKIRSLEGSLKTVNEDLTVIEKEINDATVAKESLVTLSLSRQAVANSKTNQKTKLQELDTAKAQAKATINPYAKQVYDKVAKLKTLAEEMKGLSDDNDAINEKLEYLSFWEKAFGRSGIRSLILDSVKPILDERANYYSEILTDGTVKIKFNTLKPVGKNGEFKDEFNIEARNEAGSNIYKGNSGGEKRRIDICILLALQYLAQHQSNSFMNVLFLDEIFESVDDEGQDRVIELLHTIAKEVESVLVISHVPSFASSFDNVIKIVRGQGKTTIE